ncbi:MAG: zinc-finger domain-containing protein [Ramlibacter sp.]
MNTPRKQTAIALLAKDLNPQGGVFCPSVLADMKLWNTHPRVYLDVAATGSAKCPYCGTVYQLKEGEHFGAGH